MLARLDERQRRQPEMELDIDYAVVYEGLNDRDKVMEHLSRAVDRRVGTVVLLGSFSAFVGAQSDPRFQALLDRVGLPRAVAA